MKLSAKDRRVIERFTDPIKQAHGWFGRDLEGDRLSSDGETLNGHWMGGARIAYWKNDRVHFSDLGSKAAETVQRAIKKALPSKWRRASVGRPAAKKTTAKKTTAKKTTAKKTTAKKTTAKKTTAKKASVAAKIFDEITNAANETTGRWTLRIEAAWRDGNDAGEGFEPRLRSVEREGEVGRDLKLYVVEGRLLAVGDSNGDWAVDVTDAIEEHF